MSMASIEPERIPDRDGSGRFQKGRPYGRRRGSKNMTTKAVRDALMQAFNEVGGVDYLVGVARSDPRTFCMLLAKLIPHELKLGASDDGLPVVTIKDYTGLTQAQRAAVDAVRTRNGPT